MMSVITCHQSLLLGTVLVALLLCFLILLIVAKCLRHLAALRNCIRTVEGDRCTEREKASAHPVSQLDDDVCAARQPGRELHDNDDRHGGRGSKKLRCKLLHLASLTSAK